jgi:hypothetical protein
VDAVEVGAFTAALQWLEPDDKMIRRKKRVEEIRSIPNLKPIENLEAWKGLMIGGTKNVS